MPLLESKLLSLFIYLYIYTYKYIYIYIYLYVYILFRLPLFVTLKKVYDRKVVNKYLLLGVIIYNLIDYISICIYIYIYKFLCYLGEALECPILTGVSKNTQQH